MTKPISEDLRKRVINYIKSGKDYKSAAKKYEISYSSVHRWYSRYKQTGSYKAIPYPGKKAKVSNAEFMEYVNTHPNSTLAQIGSHFGISSKSAHYYMKKCNYSYKKKSPATWSQKNHKEEKTKNGNSSKGL